MKNSRAIVGIAAVLSLATLSACGSGAPSGSTAGADGEVDTSICPDPDAATEPIKGPIKIGSIMPLSGGPAAAWSPVAEGLKLHIEHANEEGLVKGGHEIELTIGDDQYNKDQTPRVVDKLLHDGGVDFFAGILGTPNNLAVRDTLNEECVPQLLAFTGSPDWGDVENYPWTTGSFPTYTTETSVYLKHIKANFPDAAELGVFTANNELGKVYADAVTDGAGEFDLKVVEAQTIEATDANPPVAQVASIAAKKPDVIIAAPIGGQCAGFLRELANAKAATPGWRPEVFMTMNCASPVFLETVSGGKGRGVYTGAFNKFVLDPAHEKDPGVRAFNETLTEAKFKGDRAFAASGWSLGEWIVAVVNQAAESGTVSRASIMEAARSADFTWSIARDKVRFAMDGTKDPYPIESMQVVRWNGKTFDEAGATVTDFEAKSRSGA